MTKARFQIQYNAARFLAAVLVSVLASIGQAQEADLDSSIAQASAALTRLDELAGACLSVQEPGSTGPASASSETCRAFREALDGELLASYVVGCRAARAWRDAFVSRRIDSPSDDDTPASETDLLNLVSVDYWCGEQALARRSDNIMSAYALSRDGQRFTTGTANSVQQQLDTLQQQSTIEDQRTRLQDDISAQQRRVRIETDRLQNELELELIRQQNTPGYFPR